MIASTLYRTRFIWSFILFILVSFSGVFANLILFPEVVVGSLGGPRLTEIQVTTSQVLFVFVPLAFFRVWSRFEVSQLPDLGKKNIYWLLVLVGVFYGIWFVLAPQGPTLVSTVKLEYLLPLFIVNLIISLYCYYWFVQEGEDSTIYRTLRVHEIDIAKAELLKETKEKYKPIVLSYLREAIRLRRLAFISLYGVGFVVFLAIIAVVFASRLTEADQQVSSTLTQAESLQISDRDRLTNLTAENLSIDANIAAAEERLADEDTSIFEKERVADDLHAYEVRQVLLPEEISQATKQLMESNELVQNVRLQLLINAEEGGTASAVSSLNTLIASSVTRFGLVIILTFLAQALINLYRYSMRLSAFYWSNAILVAMTDGRVAEIGELSDLMSPLKVSIGREPKTPVDEAVKLLNAAKD